MFEYAAELILSLYSCSSRNCRKNMNENDSIHSCKRWNWRVLMSRFNQGCTKLSRKCNYTFITALAIWKTIPTHTFPCIRRTEPLSALSFVLYVLKCLCKTEGHCDICIIGGISRQRFFPPIFAPLVFVYREFLGRSWYSAFGFLFSVWNI